MKREILTTVSWDYTRHGMVPRRTNIQLEGRNQSIAKFSAAATLGGPDLHISVEFDAEIEEGSRESLSVARAQITCLINDLKQKDIVVGAAQIWCHKYLELFVYVLPKKGNFSEKAVQLSIHIFEAFGVRKEIITEPRITQETFIPQTGGSGYASYGFELGQKLGLRS